MGDRPKRIIQKPIRYQTTSSSESSPLILNGHIQANETTMINTLSRDINDIKTCVNNGSASNISNVQYNMQPASHLQSQTQIHTQTQYSMDNFRNDIILSSQSNADVFPQAANRHYAENNTSNIIRPISIMSQSNNYRTSNVDDRNSHSYFPVSDERYKEPVEYSMNYRKLQEQLDHIQANVIQSIQASDKNTNRIETEIKAELQTLNRNIERLLTCIQVRQNRRGHSQKPKCLPLSTQSEMEDFQKVDEQTYEEVVEYLKYVGGFTLKEAINFSFKEAIKDSVTAAYTWFGRENESKPLCNTKIVTAIYDAVCFNRNFEKPSRAEFQACIRETLRSSKQRYRTNTRVGRRQRNRNPLRQMWNDNENDIEENEEVQNIEPDTENTDEN